MIAIGAATHGELVTDTLTVYTCFTHLLTLLDYCCRIFARNMLSVDTKNVFLICGAAVAVLASAYVIWGPSESKQKKGNRRGKQERVIIAQPLKN